MAKATVRKPSAVKLCLNCKEIKPLTDFYSNKGWAEQNNCDLYCKDCATQMCCDKESLRKYLWENNRVFREEIWTTAEKMAMRVLANNAEWLSPRTSKKKKDEIKDRMICKYCFTSMNMAQYYQFVDNTDADGSLRDFNPDSTDGTIVMTEDGEALADDGAKIYSAIWNGFYTKREIEYLDGYYKQLDEGFVLDDINIQDYARKVAKASLEADSRYNNMRSGKCTSKEWKEAQDVFDSLSKASNFAACQKKDKNVGADMVLCEIIQQVEVYHQADKPMVEFEKDQIDDMLADLEHTKRAIG